MKLKLIREKFTAEYTLGSLYIDDKFFCYTVEDCDRLSKGETKIAAKTAIPKGIYKVVLTMSNRFKKVLPLLVNVPQFEGVRIHNGNTAADSEGCIIVGEVRLENGVGMSRVCMTKLMAKLENQTNIEIEIV